MDISVYIGLITVVSSIFVCVVSFAWVMLIINMHYLIEDLRIKNNELTYINTIWAWTQLIPIINFIIFTLCHIKLMKAIKSFEEQNSLSKNECQYPNILSWLFVVFLLLVLCIFIVQNISYESYSLVPIILFIMLLFVINLYIRISKTKNIVSIFKQKNLDKEFKKQ